ncbi:hypothetical protein C8J57DRAFT_1545729 [Mycena rebaudengoi]|nr:hypothetical protein C8J57DRAFT_1545729 [Mycena rebaudengoi]
MQSAERMVPTTRNMQYEVFDGVQMPSREEVRNRPNKQIGRELDTPRSSDPQSNAQPAKKPPEPLPEIRSYGLPNKVTIDAEHDDVLEYITDRDWLAHLYDDKVHVCPGFLAALQTFYLGKTVQKDGQETHQGVMLSTRMLIHNSATGAPGRLNGHAHFVFKAVLVHEDETWNLEVPYALEATIRCGAPTRLCTPQRMLPSRDDTRSSGDMLWQEWPPARVHRPPVHIAKCGNITQSPLNSSPKINFRTSTGDSIHDTFHTYEDTHTTTLDIATQHSLRDTPTNIVDFLAPNDPTYQIGI